MCMKLPATQAGLEKLPVSGMSLGEIADALAELEQRREFSVTINKTGKEYGYDEWHGR